MNFFVNTIRRVVAGLNMHISKRMMRKNLAIDVCPKKRPIHLAKILPCKFLLVALSFSNFVPINICVTEGKSHGYFIRQQRNWLQTIEELLSLRYYILTLPWLHSRLGYSFLVFCLSSVPCSRRRPGQFRPAPPCASSCWSW